MPNWLESLKAWNAQKGGKYLIPKKGTPEHNAVLAGMGGEVLKGGDAKPEPKNKKVLPKWMKPKSVEPPPKEPPVAKMSKAVATGIRKSAVERAVKKYKAQEAESERIHQERVRISEENFQRRMMESAERIALNRTLPRNKWLHDPEDTVGAKIRKHIEDKTYDNRLTIGSVLGAIFHYDFDKRYYLEFVIKGYKEGSVADKHIKERKIFTPEELRLIKYYITEEDRKWIMKTYREKPDYLLREHYPKGDVIAERVDLMFERKQ